MNSTYVVQVTADCFERLSASWIFLAFVGTLVRVGPKVVLLVDLLLKSLGTVYTQELLN